MMTEPRTCIAQNIAEDERLAAYARAQLDDGDCASIEEFIAAKRVDIARQRAVLRAL